MASRRSKSKSAIAGLRSIQTLGSLAVPGTLEQVPEEVDLKSGSNKQEIFASNDWKSVQKAVQAIFIGRFNFETNGEFYRLHQNVKNILESKTGTFLSDCYKEWLIKEMSFTAGRLRGLKDSRLLQQLEDIWINFYKNTLPTLEAVMHSVKPKGRVSIRSITLAAFRDAIALSADLEGAVRFNSDISPEIKHMILILQNVNDSYPPNKNKLRMENIAAQVFSIYLGYYGLYENGDLIVTSNEPMLASKRRPSVDISAPRRISRPFSVQPQTLDTLDELFKSAVRHRH